MTVARTPDERFGAVAGPLFEPRFRDWEGLRLAHVDEGEGPPVVLLHGQPTWSYLFRRPIERLVAAGYRCVAPDLPGFGRSDKPADVRWYSYERHVDAVATLLEQLDLSDVTLVMHDWGGPIGLRVATARAPERIARLVAVDAPILTGAEEPGDSWRFFSELVAARDELPIGRIVRMGCRRRPSREVMAAYDAPFPDAASQAGVRAFPLMVPTSPDGDVARAGRETVAALQADERPALLMWAEHDAIFPREVYAPLLARALPRGGEVLTLEGSGHFVPEDCGDRLAELVAGWLAEQGV